jgi:hypothetical protein
MPKNKRRKNMKHNLLVIVFMAFVMSSSSVYATGQGTVESGKPGIIEAVVTKIEATVEAIDHENRKVTLKGPEGKTLIIDVEERVKNLPQVEVGDLVTVEYIEAVTIQVFAEGDVEPGVTAVAAVASAEPGQKPAGVQIEEITVVATVEAIDKDQQLVTLKGAGGESKTVKARNPDNLEKVKVGDKVMISYTTVLGISVTE